MPVLTILGKPLKRLEKTRKKATQTLNRSREPQALRKDDHRTFLLLKLRGASMGFDCRDQVEARGLRVYNKFSILRYVITSHVPYRFTAFQQLST